MKFRIAVVLVLLAGVGLVGASSAGADHSWGNYHWERSSNPVVLTIGDNVGSTWDRHLDVAIADWDHSSVLTLNEGAGTASKNCRPDTGRIEVCAGSYGNNGWLGVAQIWVSGDHITKGSTRVNDFYFSMPAYDTDAWRQMVMCQELGHDFGLDHQDEDFDNANLDTCMDYTSDPSSNQHPNSHDYQQLTSIYAHLDGSDSGGSTCNPRSPKCSAGAGAAGDSPQDWGQLVRADGPHAVYVREFGNSTRVVTHVLWAD